MKTIKMIFIVLLPFIVIGVISFIGVLIVESDHKGIALLMCLLGAWFFLLNIPNMDLDGIERKIKKFLEL